VFAPPGLHDRRGRGQWELYDLADDRAERHDLAATRPDELTKLVAHWDEWAARAERARYLTDVTKADPKLGPF